LGRGLGAVGGLWVVLGQSHRRSGLTSLLLLECSLVRLVSWGREERMRGRIVRFLGLFSAWMGHTSFVPGLHGS
jgi:hypothetical protein